MAKVDYEVRIRGMILERKERLNKSLVRHGLFIELVVLESETEIAITITNLLDKIVFHCSILVFADETIDLAKLIEKDFWGIHYGKL